VELVSSCGIVCPHVGLRLVRVPLALEWRVGERARVAIVEQSEHSCRVEELLPRQGTRASFQRACLRV